MKNKATHIFLIRDEHGNPVKAQMMEREENGVHHCVMLGNFPLFMPIKGSWPEEIDLIPIEDLEIEDGFFKLRDKKHLTVEEAARQYAENIRRNMFQIKIIYETGNSFGTSKETDYLELTWADIEQAKLNLRRIKEHYDWYDYEQNKRGYLPVKKFERPAWHKEANLNEYQIQLLTDSGKPLIISAFWCGYFETLLRIEILGFESDTCYEF